MAGLASPRMPWEHANGNIQRRMAADWLRAQGRHVKRVHIVECWAVFYESLEGEARHQRWRPDPKDINKLILEGPHRAGWPVAP